MPRPVAGSYPPYFENYINKVDSVSVGEAIAKYSDYLVDFFNKIPAEKATHSYAAGKWTLKEMLLHIIDTERIFTYRAVTIARGDKTPLPGFDENTYAANSKADTRSWKSLLLEFAAVRQSSDLLLQSFDDEQLLQSGTTNSNPTTVNALAFITFGHILHHIEVIKERYL